MSVRKSKVEVGYIDTKFSSGDSNKMTIKQQFEENNNQVDELSKELSEMGCIVDAAKRPPNICVETCVHDDIESEDGKSKTTQENEDDNYSDVFEDDNSDNDDQSISEVKSVKSEGKQVNDAKVTKSQSSMSSRRTPVSVTGRSNYGSVSVPPTRRINMSFTNDRLREIERHNHILLNKILSARNTRTSSIPAKELPPRRQVPPAAVHRKQLQRKIDHDNMILLKKIQRAKSSSYSFRR